MLTIKNWRVPGAFVFLVFALAFTGCTPPGPRAVLKGKKFLDHGRFSEAVEQLKFAVSVLPTNAPAWNYLGLAYHQTGQVTNAAFAYQRALAIDHDLAEARYNLGCLWLEQNRFDAAKAELTAFTSLRRYSGEGWVKLGMAQLQSSRAENRSAELAAAERSFNEAIRLNPRSPEALNGSGLVQMQRGRVKEAAQCFENALKLQPNYPPALLNLAIVSQAHLKDRAAALEYYRAYLAHAPGAPNEASISAVVRELELELNPAPRPAAPTVAAPTRAGPATIASVPPAAQKPQQTTEVAVVSPTPSRSATADGPKVQPASRTTAPATSVSTAPAAAPAAEPRTVASRPGPKTAPAPEPPPSTVAEKRPTADESGISYPRYRYQSPPKPAEGDRQSALSAFAEGVAAQRDKRLAEAMQAYRRAMQFDPAYYEAAYNLGLAAAGAGNMSQALLAYETALAIRPESLDARYNFAWALKQSNFVIDAANELEKILATYPAEPRAHLALGNIYAQQWRQPAKAREHYLKVLENDPRNPQGPAIRDWLATH